MYCYHRTGNRRAGEKQQRIKQNYNQSRVLTNSNEFCITINALIHNKQLQNIYRYKISGMLKLRIIHVICSEHCYYLSHACVYQSQRSSNETELIKHTTLQLKSWKSLVGIWITLCSIYSTRHVSGLAYNDVGVSGMMQKPNLIDSWITVVTCTLHGHK
jgi:hypothetical protein